MKFRRLATLSVAVISLVACAKQPLVVEDARSEDKQELIEVTDSIPNTCLPYSAVMHAPDEITIKIHNSRGWAKNLIHAFIDSKDNIIDKKYRKRYPGSISFTLNDYKCVFKASVRVSGDLKDHISLVQGDPVSSLDVVLSDGNIGGITSFKLFLPATRNNDNEVVNAAIFRELGLLSPRTRYIKAVVNGVNVRYIMQEKMEKEFAESNRLRESAFTRLSEALYWSQRPRLTEEYLRGLLFPSIMNDNWFMKSEINRQITIRALNQLSDAFVNTSSGYLFDRSINEDLFMWPGSISRGKSNKEASLFALLLLATGSAHGYHPNNMRFYYDPFVDTLRPIYYDGNSDILKQVKDPGYDPTSNSLTERVLRQIYKDLDISYAKSKIRDLDTSSLVASIERSGLGFSVAEAKELKKRLYENLLLIERAINSYRSQVALDKAVKERLMRKSYPTLRSHKQLNYNLIHSDNASSYYACKMNKPQSCHKIELTLKKLKRLVSGSGPKLNDYQSFYLNTIPFKYNPKGLHGYRERQFDSSFSARVYGSPVIEVDKQRKNILVNIRSEQERIVIHDSDITNWTISVVAPLASSTNTNNGSRYDQNLLTGALVIQDSKISGVTLSFIGGFLEDSINIIRSEGFFESITVENSYQDALDIDFSDLVINKVNVINAGNDCLDLSAGQYRIFSGSVKGCTDKGVSLGENGSLEVKDISIKDSGVGIVSKDSSIARFDKVSVENTSKCFAVYRKKQEFGGAMLILPKSSCRNLPYSIQPLSDYKSNDAT